MIFQNYWTPPFRYDPEGSCVWDAKNNMILDVRGYGYLTGKGSLGLSDVVAYEVQDQVGTHIAGLLNDNWPKR